MESYGLMDWNPQVLCWNVRGLNNMSKRNVVRNFISEAKVNLVCLQETKFDVIDAFVVMQCIGHPLMVLLICRRRILGVAF